MDYINVYMMFKGLVNMKNNKQMWKDLMSIFFRQKKYIITLMILIFSVATIDVIFPLLNKVAIDYFATSLGSENEFILFISAYLICYLASACRCDMPRVYTVFWIRRALFAYLNRRVHNSRYNYPCHRDGTGVPSHLHSCAIAVAQL